LLAKMPRQCLANGSPLS